MTHKNFRCTSAIAATRQLASLPILAACLPEFETVTSLPVMRPGDYQAVVGWGLKPTTTRARHLAQRHGLPYVAIEDGFLRSWGLGVQGYSPHSLAVDHTGIYYDATRPSDLEHLIQQAHFTDDELARASRCMALLKQYRLSKYNHAPDTPLPHSERPRVLVVDQTAGDASIEYGLATANSFTVMLQCALSENPDADILVKLHPDVVAGKKSGHLLQAADHPRCHLIGDDLNPWALFDSVDIVHVVTSQLGIEALMAGKRVVCHGMPFYAGWGLTDDRVQCDRRSQTRALEELFYAAYIRYCRYANPYTGRLSSLEETIFLISDQKRQHERLAGRWWGIGFSSWKRGFVGDFLGEQAKLHHVGRPEQAQPIGQDRLLLWSSQTDGSEHASNTPDETPRWRMEDGFIRSVGLGVDLVRPLSLVVDSRGIYYDPRQPSDLEHLLQNTPFDSQLLARARALRQCLVTLKLSKYNVGHSRPASGEPPPRSRTLLVIGQVETDASIRFGSPTVNTNTALIEQVRAHNPDAYLIYKPHPDVVSGARVGNIADDAQHLYDCEVVEESISNLLDRVEEVHTMSSLAGFEGLLRGCRVTTYGTPFYAGWGLTNDMGKPCTRRTRRLELDELVAGTLILYPTYVDPHSQQLINAETAVDWLAQHRNATRGLSLSRRLYRMYRHFFIGKH